MIASDKILGVILAGGTARRLFPASADGGDKGLTLLGGAPMLSHVARRFRPQVGRLILNANGDPQRFAAFGLGVVPDLDARAQGPLAGILAAMTWAAGNAPEITHLATVTTDVPFLPLDLVARLAAAGAVQPAIAVSADQRHPTIGLWPLALQSAVQAALERGDLSVNSFAMQHGAIAVSFLFGESGGALVDPFFNANTPDDLAAAETLLSRAK
jgi:molybdenum cofactor guanylyltransferase